MYTNWYKTLLIKEASLTVPASVMADVKQYVLDAYTKLKSQGLTKVHPASFPKKAFILNFKGTQWEFLGTPMPLTIDFLHTYNNTSTFYWRGGYPLIVFNLAEPLDHLIGTTIEHEIGHFIQELIKYKNKLKEIGGLPPQKYWGNTDLDVEGYKKVEKKDIPNSFVDLKGRTWTYSPTINKYTDERGHSAIITYKYDDKGRKVPNDPIIAKHIRLLGPQRPRRGEHITRPTELYNDLITMARTLTIEFYRHFNTITKPEFFKAFINKDDIIKANRMLNWQRSEMDVVLKKYPEMRNWWTTKLYDEFINKDPIDFEEIDRAKSDIQTKTKEISDKKSQLLQTKKLKQEQKQEKAREGDRPIINGKVIVGKNNNWDPVWEYYDIMASDFNLLGKIRMLEEDFSYVVEPNPNGEYVDQSYELSQQILKQLPYCKVNYKSRETLIEMPAEIDKVLKILRKIKEIKPLFPGENLDELAKEYVTYIAQAMHRIQNKSFNVDDFLKKYYY